jgi:acylphosphatase
MSDPQARAVVVRAAAQVRGRVQGVWYRGSTREQALRLDLRGWVRNLPDGTVRLEVQGPRDRVEELLRWCHEGPEHAIVTGVDVAWDLPLSTDEASFAVLR